MFTRGLLIIFMRNSSTRGISGYLSSTISSDCSVSFIMTTTTGPIELLLRSGLYLNILCELNGYPLIINGLTLRNKTGSRKVLTPDLGTSRFTVFVGSRHAIVICGSRDYLFLSCGVQYSVGLAIWCWRGPGGGSVYGSCFLRTGGSTFRVG